jgi:hypothetical protein
VSDHMELSISLIFEHFKAVLALVSFSVRSPVIF